MGSLSWISNPAPFSLSAKAVLMPANADLEICTRFYFVDFFPVWLKVSTWLNTTDLDCDSLAKGGPLMELLFTESHSYSEEEVSLCSKNKCGSLKHPAFLSFSSSQMG